MKRIRKSIIYGLILFGIIGTSVSCSSGGYSLGDFALSWVTALDDSGHSFMLDNGKTMWVAASDTYNTPKSKRVYINYTPLGDNFQGYDYAIKLNGYLDNNILTKNVIYANLNSQQVQDSLGKNTLSLEQYWSGGGYLNAELFVLQEGMGKHMFSLVSPTKDYAINNDTITLELRHKNVDKPNSDTGYPALARISFDLKPMNIVHNETKKVILKIKYRNPNGENTYVLAEHILREYKNGETPEEMPEGEPTVPNENKYM